MTYYPERLSKHSKTYLVIIHLVGGLLFAIALSLLFGYAVMWLWNAVIPSILPAHSITYWQSVGLLVLTRILVGGIGGHGGHRSSKDYRHGEAWRKYDDWWKEVGQQSFDQFSNPQQK